MPVGGGFGGCSCGGSDCPAQTTPIATTGLCLPDGTPLAVIIERDCSGTTQQTGWMNLASGAYTTGVPPAGAAACGDSRSIQVSGVFCDLASDGTTVLGLVLVEYHYADDGSIDSVRLVSAATGETYVLQGTLTICPGGGGDDEESPGELGCVRQVVAQQGCDDADGDGLADTRYTKLWSVDPCTDTDPVLLGTYRGADFTTPYEPLAPLDCDPLAGEESPGAPEPVCAPQIIERFGCDDTTGDGTGDVRYTELWAIDPCGSAPPALLGAYADGDLTQPYTPVSPVDCAPGGDGDESPGEPQPRYQVTTVPLCVIDTEGSGGVLQRILAEIVYDTATGERTGVRYVDQATGDPVALPGGSTIAVCPDSAEPCASSVTTLRLCDLNPDVAPDSEGKRCATPFLRHLVFDCTGALVDQHDTGLDGTAYTPVEVVDCSNGVPALVEVPWNITGIAPDPADTARGLIYTLSPDDDPTITATVAVHVTSNINSTCPATPPNYAVSNPCTYTFTPDATLQDVATYVRVDLLDFDSFEPVGSLNPRPDRLGGTAVFSGTNVVPTVSNGVGEMYYDGPPAQMSYRVGNTGGGTSCSALSFAAVSLKPEGCCGCTGDGGGADNGRTVQELCVISTGAPDTVQTWTRIIEADGTTIYYLDPTGQRFDTTLPAGFIIVACAPPTGATVQVIPLCDTAADGEVTAFLRHVAADDTGATTTVTDTTLDGTTPYTPVGAVGVCGETGEEEESPGELGCVHCETLTLCDVQPDDEESPGPGTEVPWATVSVVEDPATAGDHTDFIFTISPQDDPSVVGTVHVNVTRPAGGACGAFDIDNLVFSNTAQYHLELDEVAQQVSFLRVDLLDFDNFEPVAILTGTPEPTRLGGTAVWDAGHNRIVPTENDSVGELYWDAPPASIAYEIFNTGGGTSCSRLSFAGVTIVPPPPPPPAGTATSFLRTVCRSCDGAVLSVTDTTLDGAPYVPAGVVAICDAGSGSSTEPCRNTSSLLLCEQAGSTGEASGDLTATAIPDATPFNGWRGFGRPTESSWCQVDGDPGTLWSGGTTTLGPGEPCADGAASMHAVVAAALSADVGDCDQVDVTVSVRVELLGPNRGVAGDGIVSLWNVATQEQVAWKQVASGAPVGHVETITLTTQVSGADLAAGAIAVSVDLETEHSGEKSWTADQFTATFDASGCATATAFLRHVTTDCDGNVVAQTDTDLDGQPITVTGEVGQCTSAGGGETAPGLDVEVLQLCDKAEDADPVPFLRHLVYTNGAVPPSVIDTTLDGTTPYMLAGDAVDCATAEPCRDSSSTLLCDAADQEPITVFDPANVPGSDGWQVVSYTTVTGNPPEAALPYDAPHPPGPLMGARTDLSAGVGPAWPGYDAAPHRWVLRKTFTAPEDGIATVSSTGFRGDGGARVRVNSVDAGMYGQWNQPATSGTAQIPVTAGPNVVEIEVRDGAGNNWVQGRLDIVMIKTVQFMRRQTVDCETGAVIETTDTTLDGEPYTVAGEVGQCTPAAECCEQPPPELRVDVESDVMCIRTQDGEVTGQVLVERVYDDQSGDRVVQRLADPTTGDEVTLPDGAELVLCQEPACPVAFSTECVGEVTRTEAGYDNTSLINGVPGKCGSVQGPNGQFPCQPTSGGYTIVSWTVDGEEVIGEDGGRTFAGGPCGEGAPGNLGMHHNWSLALTNLDPSGATWSAQSAEGCAWFVGSTGGTQTVYGPMIVVDDMGQRWTLGPAQQCEETQYTKVYSQECDGTVSVSWLDAQGVPTDAPTGDLVPCGTGCGKSGGAGLDVEVIQLCDVSDAESGTATSTPFLRHFVYDTGGTVTFVADTGLDGLTPYTPAGAVGVCASGGCESFLREECRWDDADGDGVGDVRYVELLTVDGCTGALTTVGTYAPGLTGPYEPVAPVAEGPAAAGPAARGVQAHRLVLPPGASWDAGTVPLLQSVSVVARGTASVTTADGVSGMVAGESIGWSVAREADAALTGPLTVTAGDGPVAVAWTAGVVL